MGKRRTKREARELEVEPIDVECAVCGIELTLYPDNGNEEERFTCPTCRTPGPVCKNSSADRNHEV